MKLQFVVTFIVNMLATILFRMITWVGTLNPGIQDIVNTSKVDGWLNLTSLVIFMFLTIRHLLKMLDAKEKAQQEMHKELLEAFKEQTKILSSFMKQNA